MKKKILVLFIIILSLPLVSAGLFGLSDNQIIGLNIFDLIKNGIQNENILCIETDGGLDLENQGTTSGRYGVAGAKTFTDRCINWGPYQGQIVEYFCFDSEWMQFHRSNCPTGTICENGACTTPLVKIAGINLSNNDYSFTNLEAKFDSVLTNHQELDLILTPEYIFYQDQTHQDNPVIVDCQTTPCTISSIGTQESDQLVDYISSIQNLAQQYHVYIVLGTVAERSVVNGYDISYNTLLILDRNGDIIGKQRKSSPYDFYIEGDIGCNEEPALCEDIRMEALPTIQAYDLIDLHGNIFTIIPVICGDLGDDDSITQLENSYGDLIVFPLVDADPYQDVMYDILAGLDPLDNPSYYTAEGLTAYIFRDEYQSRELTVQNSYLFSANGGNNNGVSIIPLDYQTMYNLDIHEDYTYGEIEITS
ncbi:hypothetical protein HOD38_01690 [archaeon]|jgi:hypothetical protein|nr:hypothetical protein [archaeon]MBT4396957.1 hypothetical protein [archaeon]MBT4440948.1 hypothetical protein [archaeon]